MNIREVKESDVDIIGSIYAKAFGYNEKIVSYYKGFGEYVNFCVKQNYAFVIEDKTEICGVILGYEKPDWNDGKNLYIELLAILPEYQGKGYGKALIDKIESVAKDNGIKELSLRTACYYGSISCLSSFGF